MKIPLTPMTSPDVSQGVAEMARSTGLPVAGPAAIRRSGGDDVSFHLAFAWPALIAHILISWAKN